MTRPVNLFAASMLASTLWLAAPLCALSEPVESPQTEAANGEVDPSDSVPGPKTISGDEANPLQGRFLPQVLKTSKVHTKTLLKLIGGRPGIPPWVRGMVTRDLYVALASERIEVSGKPMERFEACEAGRCDTNRITLLFSPDGRHVAVRILDQRLGEVLLGDPSPEEKLAF